MEPGKKVVLIVGAAGGIGKAVVKKMASANLHFVLADQNQRKLDLTNINPGEASVDFEVLDLTNKENIQDLVCKIDKSHGRLDAIVNAAGVCEFIGFQDISEESWDHLFNVNLKGPFFLCQAAASIMMRQQTGNIINIASIAGENNAVYAGLHYSASKSGLITMSKVLAKVLAPYNIRVNVISPGPVNTEMLNCWTDEMRTTFTAGIPLGRFAEPEDIANAVIFLVGSDSNYITGQVLRLNGGALM